MSTVKYPFKWLGSNIDSEAKAESLFKPELENGTLNLHDYESAKKFYPGVHRHFPSLFGNVFAMGTVLFSSFTRPRWSMMRVVPVASVAFLVGHQLGFRQKLVSHLKFLRTLEDPEGFNQALQNINMRLGGTIPWDVGIPIKENSELQTSIEGLASSADERSANDNIPWDTPNSSSSAEAVSQPITTNPTSSRWGQIRAANSNTGHLSSWDTIRQAHEHNRVQSPSSSRSQQHETLDFERKEESTRALDEARFDAMLEAERRRTPRS